jgi:predicted amidohydrolase YtcJ
MTAMIRRVRALLAIACTLAPMRAQAPDLVLISGNIVTVDDRFATVEALAARNGRILAVGSDDEIKKLIGAGTSVLDLKGRTAIPGFIEGHGHFVGLGDAMQILDLTKVDNWDQVVVMVAAAAKRTAPGEWILGRGWHQEKWNRTPAGAVKGFPPHESISAVSPDNPVALTHASGHASFFNAKAMELAGVGAATEDPPGGEIIRDAEARPIGVFSETAQGLVSRFRSARELRRTPAQRREDLRRKIDLATQECLRKGVTSFQDAGNKIVIFHVDFP